MSLRQGLYMGIIGISLLAPSISYARTVEVRPGYTLEIPDGKIGLDQAKTLYDLATELLSEGNKGAARDIANILSESGPESKKPDYLLLKGRILDDFGLLDSVRILYPNSQAASQLEQVLVGYIDNEYNKVKSNGTLEIIYGGGRHNDAFLNIMTTLEAYRLISKIRKNNVPTSITQEVNSILDTTLSVKLVPNNRSYDPSEMRKDVGDCLRNRLKLKIDWEGPTIRRLLDEIPGFHSHDYGSFNFTIKVRRVLEIKGIDLRSYGLPTTPSK